MSEEDKHLADRLLEQTLDRIIEMRDRMRMHHPEMRELHKVMNMAIKLKREMEHEHKR